MRGKRFTLYKNSGIFKYYLTNAQNMLKRYHKHESFIKVMFKTKKSRLRIRKKNLSKEEQNIDRARVIRQEGVD